MSTFNSLYEIYILVKRLTDLVIFIMMVYIVWELSTFTIIDTYNKINDAGHMNMEKMDIKEILIYLLIKMKNSKFFIVFWIYFIIFKKIAPIVLIFFILMTIKETPKILLKNNEITLQSFSLNLLQNLKGYCTISTILYYYFKIICKIYPKAKYFTTFYTILEKKK